MADWLFVTGHQDEGLKLHEEALELELAVIEGIRNRVRAGSVDRYSLWSKQLRKRGQVAVAVVAGHPNSRYRGDRAVRDDAGAKVTDIRHLTDAGHGSDDAGPIHFANAVVTGVGDVEISGRAEGDVQIAGTVRGLTGGEV
jgi:hypothetical protein